MSGKRIDLVDGQAYTWREYSAYYKGKYSKSVIESHWEASKPVEGKVKGNSISSHTEGTDTPNHEDRSADADAKKTLKLSSTARKANIQNAIAAFDKLPLLSEAMASQQLVEKLREEFIAVLECDLAESDERCARDALSASIKALLSLRKKNVDKEIIDSARQNRNLHELSVKATGEELQRSRKSLQAFASDISNTVKTHYRTSSVKVHPDRHGEESRDRFELLQRASGILAEKDLRHQYCRTMIEVVLKVPEMIGHAHELWISRHLPAAVNYKRPSTGIVTSRSSVNRITEGGLGNRLRCPEFRSWGARGSCQEHSATLALTLSDDAMDLEAVKQVRCQLLHWENISCGWRDQEPVNALPLCEKGTMHVHIDVGCYGHFQIRWRIEYHFGEGGSCSQWSNPIDLDHVDPKVALQQRAQYEAYRKLVWHKSTMCYAISYFERSFELNRNGPVEQALVRLQSESSKVSRLIESYKSLSQACVGAVDNGVVDEMCSLHARAEHLLRAHRDANAIVAMKEKQRGFRIEVAARLQTNAMQWLEDSNLLSKEKLAELGGTANRLYQILVDNPKGYLNARAYSMAAGRKDLFTAKQRCRLLQLSKALTEERGRQHGCIRKDKNQSAIDSGNPPEKKTRRYVRRGFEILAERCSSLLTPWDRATLAPVARAAGVVFGKAATGNSCTSITRSLGETCCVSLTPRTCDMLDISGHASQQTHSQMSDKAMQGVKEGAPSACAKTNPDAPGDAALAHEEDAASAESLCSPMAPGMQDPTSVVYDLQRRLKESEEKRLDAETRLRAFREKELAHAMDSASLATEAQVVDVARCILAGSAGHASHHVSEVLEVDALRFTQDSIAARFQDQRLVTGLVDDLLAGRVDPCRHANLVLDVVRFQGAYRCLNNRRLWALKEYQQKLTDKKNSLKPVRVRARVFSLCAVTTRFLLTNTSDNNGFSTRVRSLSRAPRSASRDAGCKTRESSHARRSQLRQASAGILNDSHSGPSSSRRRSSSRKLTVQIRDDRSPPSRRWSSSNKAVVQICGERNTANAWTSAPTPGCPPRELASEWEKYRDPTTSRHWWWHPVEQRATFVDPTSH